MIKRAIFEGEKEQLLFFLDMFYEAQGIKEIPELEEGMSVILRVNEEKNEEQFLKWALSFGLKCTFIETTN